jgi:hypothetical protein
MLDLMIILFQHRSKDFDCFRIFFFKITFYLFIHAILELSRCNMDTLQFKSFYVFELVKEKILKTTIYYSFNCHININLDFKTNQAKKHVDIK